VMFEGLVNSLLQKYLAPYIEGLDVDKLSIGWGNFELKDLVLKKNLFATLGIDVVELESGKLGRLGIAIPLTQLTSGKLSVEISGLDVVACAGGAGTDGKKKSDEDALTDLRLNRHTRVETRVEALRELKQNQKLIDAAKKAGGNIEAPLGFGAKVARQFVQNFTLRISDISAGLKNPAQKSEFAVRLNSASVLSPQAADPPTATLVKQISVEALRVVGGTCPEPAALLKPLSLALVFRHDPAAGEIGLNFDMGQEGEGAALAVSQTQLQLLAGVAKELGRESARLSTLVTPEGTKELVDVESEVGVEGTRVEFVDLVRREKGNDLDLPAGTADLSSTDKWRLQVLWDVVPEEMLARWVVPVSEEIELVAERRAAEAKAAASASSFFGRMMGRKAADPATPEDYAEQFKNLQSECEQLANLEPPSKVLLNVNLPSFVLELSGGAGENVLRSTLLGMVTSVNMLSKIDHRGIPGADLSVTTALQGLSLMHRDVQPVLTFGLQPALPGEFQDAMEESNALQFAFRNRLEEARTLLEISLDILPTDLYLPETLIPSLMSFKNAASASLEGTGQLVPKGAGEGANKALDGYLSTGEQWLDSPAGKKALEGAKKRIPDAMQVHVHLSGPRVHVPVFKMGDILISFGKLDIDTPSACTADGLKLGVVLSDMELTVIDSHKHRREIIAPFALQAMALVAPTSAEVDLRLDGIKVTASPHLAKILAAAPQALTASLGQDSAKGEHGKAAEKDKAPPVEVDAHMRAHARVVVANEFTSHTRDPVVFKVGEHGTISELDKAGDALIDFEGHDQLQWVKGEDFGNLDILVVLKADDVITVKTAFTTSTEGAALEVKPGQRGRVVEVDEDGDALVHFDGNDKKHWVNGDDFRFLVAGLRRAEPPRSYESQVALRAGKFRDLAKQKAASMSAPAGFNFRIGLVLGESSVLLLDAACPVLSLQMELQAFEFSSTGGALDMPAHCMVETFGEEGSKEFGRQSLRFAANVFSLRVGRFEPLLEPFELTCQLEKTDDSTTVKVNGRRPLLVNATPTALRLLGWYVPHFLSQLAAPLDAKRATRYRLLNLTDNTINLQFPGDAAKHAQAPSGLSWRSLDGLVLPRVCQSVEVDNGLELSLLQLGSVRLVDGAPAAPAPGLVLQLLRPRVEYALLLVSSPCLIFNDTSLALDLRFPGASAQLACTYCAEVALIDGAIGAHCDPTEDSSGAASSSSVMKPGMFASCPVTALQRADNGKVRVSWEVMPEGGDWAGAPGKAPSPSVEMQAAVPVQCGKIRLLAHLEDSISAPPAREPLHRIRLLPSLHLFSGLPCALEVEYRLATETEKAARHAILPPCGEVMVYDISTPGRVSLRVRLEGGGWSDWGMVSIGDGKNDGEEASAEVTLGGSATLDMLARGFNGVAMYCPSWVVDRTGWGLSMRQGTIGLPDVAGVSLCGSGLDNYVLSMHGKGGPSFSIPADAGEWGTATLNDGRTICVRSKPLPKTETQGCPVRYLELVPRIILHNASERVVEFKVGDVTVSVSAQETVAPTCKLGALCFRASSEQAWSSPFTAEEESAGAAAFLLGDETWTAEVRADNGLLCVSLREGSDYIVHNYLEEDIEVQTRGASAVIVPPGQERIFGWVDPFKADVERGVTIKLGKAVSEIDSRVAVEKSLGDSAIVKSKSLGMSTRLEVHPASQHQKRTQVLKLELTLPRIGMSVIGERGDAPCELLYLEIELLKVKVEIRPNEDRQLVDVKLADLQLDWQVGSEASVVIRNLGGASDDAAKPFFHMMAERRRISSPDVDLRAVKIDMDQVEVCFDDKLMDSVKDFIQESTPPAVTGGSTSVSLQVPLVRRRAGKALLEDGWEMPPMCKAFQIDGFAISTIVLCVWCSLKLQPLPLPKWIKHLVMTLSFSDSLSLEGSNISLKNKELAGARGSIADFVRTLSREYVGDVLGSLGSLLGNSSLLALPKAPLKLGSGVVGGATQITGSLAAGIESLTFDKEYVERQKLARKKKKIGGLGSGITSAFEDIGEGLSGIGDIVRKPMAGAREGGIGGFLGGIGQGLVCAIAKPVGAIGNAVTDLGSGVAAGVGSIATKTRDPIERSRPPRVLAGPLGAVIEYSSLDAEVALKLNFKDQIELVVPLVSMPSDPKAKDSKSEDAADSGSVLALVIFSESVVVAEVQQPEVEGDTDDADANASLLLCLRGEGRYANDTAGVEWTGKFPLKSVEWKAPLDNENRSKVLSVTGAEGTSFDIPTPWQLGAALNQALFDTLTAATKKDVKGDWTKGLRSALSRARFQSVTAAAEKALDAGTKKTADALEKTRV